MCITVKSTKDFTPTICRWSEREAPKQTTQLLIVSGSKPFVHLNQQQPRNRDRASILKNADSICYTIVVIFIVILQSCVKISMLSLKKEKPRDFFVVNVMERYNEPFQSCSYLNFSCLSNNYLLHLIQLK